MMGGANPKRLKKQIPIDIAAEVRADSGPSAPPQGLGRGWECQGPDWAKNLIDSTRISAEVS